MNQRAGGIDAQCGPYCEDCGDCLTCYGGDACGGIPGRPHIWPKEDADV